MLSVLDLDALHNPVGADIRELEGVPFVVGHHAQLAVQAHPGTDSG